MKNKQLITVTRAMITKMKKEATEVAFAKAVQLFMLALHDEFGFGAERLERLLVRVNLYADHLDEHRISMKQMEEIWEKNTGFTMGSAKVIKTDKEV